MNASFKIEGFVKIFDPMTKEILLEKKNQINYEAMSEALADSLSGRGYGEIFQMAFGNGGTLVDETGVITYLPPNVTGGNAALYNQTFVKIVDDTSVFNADPTRNKMTVSHETGKVYTDILVQCLLDYGEPSGQAAFDNSTQTDSTYVFDELGLLANYGVDVDGNVITRLISHVLFHPFQKALNRQIQVDYVIRIQAITSITTPITV